MQQNQNTIAVFVCALTIRTSSLMFPVRPAYCGSSRHERRQRQSPKNTRTHTRLPFRHESVHRSCPVTPPFFLELPSLIALIKN